MPGYTLRQDDSMTDKKTDRSFNPEAGARTREDGFSLLEVVFALVIIMVALLGVFSALTYAITFNAGNKNRSQAIAVMQQEVERYRAAKFNSTVTDSFASPADPGLCRTDGLRDLTGRNATECRVVAVDGLQFIVQSSVDNAPDVAGNQVSGYVCLTPQGTATPCTLKEVMISVRLAPPSPGWQTAIPVTTVLRRVRGN